MILEKAVSVYLHVRGPEFDDRISISRGHFYEIL